MRLLWLADGARAGSTNMDIDRRAWKISEETSDAPILLRTYSWSPAALSLGFHQSDADIDTNALRERGIDLVRRPSGGAAVLHSDEITYCICAPLGVDGIGRGVLEIYGAIASVLSVGLRRFGVESALGGGGRPEGFACFSAAGGHELTVGGKKLVGSALRRGRQGFLQHGSILRGDDHLALFDLMRPAPTDDGSHEREQLKARTTNLRALGAADLDVHAFTRVLAEELGERVGVDAEEACSIDGFLHPAETQP